MSAGTMVLSSKQPAALNSSSSDSSSQCCSSPEHSSSKSQRRFSLTGLLRIASSAKSSSGDKVKNLYRRPNTTSKKTNDAAQPSLTAVPMAVLKKTALKRAQFANRMLLLETSSDLDSDCEGAQDCCDVKHAEQCCRKRAPPSPGIPGSILKKCCRESINCNSSSADKSVKKQTSFKENVEIFYYDGIDSDNTCKDSAKLKVGSSVIWCDVAGHETPSRDVDCAIDSEHKSNNAAAVVSTHDYTDSIFQCREVMVLQQAGVEHLTLRLVLQLRDEFSNYICSVKALSSGRSLTVTIKHPVENTENCQSSAMQQLTEKVSMPLKVDPCHIKVAVNGSGLIAVDAPLV